MQQPASGLSDDQYNDRLRELEEEENAKRQALQELTQPDQAAPVPATAEEQPVQQEQPAQTAQETTVTEEAAEPQEPEGEPKEGMTIESLDESQAGRIGANLIPGQKIRDTAMDGSRDRIIPDNNNRCQGRQRCHWCWCRSTHDRYLLFDPGRKDQDIGRTRGCYR